MKYPTLCVITKDGVDLDKVWVVIKEDLSTLKQQIQKIKKDFESLDK